MIDFLFKSFLPRCVELRGTRLSYKEKVSLQCFGFAIIIVGWQLVYELQFFSKSILPSIPSIFSAMVDLFVIQHVINDIAYSLALNVVGLLEAAIVCLPLGILLGLFPGPRAMSERMLASARYIPMTAAIGVFIGLFGIYFNMKLQFLAVSVMLYLLPTVVYHIDQVPQVLVDTMTTLGASRWQIIRRVYIKSIMPDFYFSVINLSAISWTYIVVAESMNAKWGIGALAYSSGRQSHMDVFWASMLLIGIIGFALDKSGALVGRKMYKYKFLKKGE